MKRVVIVQEYVPHYRQAFFENLRSELNSKGVELIVILGRKKLNRFIAADLEWMTPVRISRLGKLAWHHAWKNCSNADLIIFPQEVKYAMLHLSCIRRRFVGGPKIALWGHGKSFQRNNQNSLTERLKKYISIQVDWWFAYNELSAKVVNGLGYPRHKITIVKNSIDTKSIRNEVAQWDPERLQIFRSKNRASGKSIGIFTGGLYEEKRIEFLVEAAQFIHKKIPDFQLWIIGDGPFKKIVQESTFKHEWIQYFGKLNDVERVPHWMCSQVALMPGLVGLVIVDSFAFGVPLITTEFPFHSPEIDYLKPGKNGLLIHCGDNPQKYAEAVIGLFSNAKELSELQCGAFESCDEYSIETMAFNMSSGIIKALSH